MDIYAQNVLDHYKNPRNMGEIENASASVKVVNPSCGDQMKLDVLIEEEKIKDIKFSGQGCAVSQAAISIMSEEIVGMSVEEAYDLKKEDVFEMLGVPISKRRIKCATMALLALKNAIREYRKEEHLKWIDVLG